MSNCQYCGVETDGRMFCSDRHKAAWHRERTPEGVVRSVRFLKNGGASVSVHFPPGEMPRAVTYRVGQEVFLGRSSDYAGGAQ